MVHSDNDSDFGQSNRTISWLIGTIVVYIRKTRHHYWKFLLCYRSVRKLWNCSVLRPKFTHLPSPLAYLSKPETSRPPATVHPPHRVIQDALHRRDPKLDPKIASLSFLGSFSHSSHPKFLPEFHLFLTEFHFLGHLHTHVHLSHCCPCMRIWWSICCDCCLSVCQSVSRDQREGSRASARALDFTAGGGGGDGGVAPSFSSSSTNRPGRQAARQSIEGGYHQETLEYN